MAQLSDDCFAFGGALLSVDDALARIEERITRVVDIATTPLGCARGRVLARDVVSSMNLPPHANSAVDGYAFAHADLVPGAETVLPVSGRAAAGHPLGQPAQRGAAVRIFTGAPMPDGTDTVMMQEDCVVEGGRVHLKPGIRKGANRRHAGEDVAEGAVALAAGRRLAPADLGLAAALGHCELAVFRPLRVALLSTGDEVCEPGMTLSSGMTYDANRFMLAALLEGLGCEVSDFGIRPDREAALADTLVTASQDHDLIVTSGGVSTGEEDHVRPAIERLGRLHFWRLAIKPGRPVALGQISGVPLIGLPGNPVAALVTFVVLARPLIFKLAGATEVTPRLYPVRAGFSYRKKPGRREYVRVSLRRDGGDLVAVKYPRDGAGILSSITQSEGLAIVDEETSELSPGTGIDFLPFSEVGA
ncbi:MAG: molybdopterin molybdotransferase MoeA [Alphaproteobacteria bacterium]|nr:molybdopterin molybdotransferase MoeA [Alphaproteobacteria bacterium]MBV9378484.1 molybdopterin molybdotransferase MoeA [Alphaproteobacteria bacterium]